MSQDNPQPPTQNQPSASGGPSSKNHDKNITNNNNNSGGNNKSNNSLLDRIQNSASNLIRDTVTNPSPWAVGSELQGLGRGKASSSASTSTSTSAAGSVGSASGGQWDGKSSIVGTSSAATSTYPVETFRSSAIQNQSSNSSSSSGAGFNNLETFNAEHFQNDYGSEKPSLAASSTSTGKGKGKSAAFIPPDYSSTEYYYDNAWNNATPNHQQQVQQTSQSHNNTQDGAAVVSLLSSTSFNADFAEDQPDDYNTDYEPIIPLTAEEIKILDSFRRQFKTPSPSPSSTTTNNISSTHPAITAHSLIPDIDTFLTTNDNLYQSINNDDISLRDAVLRDLPGAEDWMVVNDRYQDEVWGYLRPALEAASKELEEEKSTATTKDEDVGDMLKREGPAVRRLKMILRHMQL